MILSIAYLLYPFSIIHYICSLLGHMFSFLLSYILVAVYADSILYANSYFVAKMLRRVITLIKLFVHAFMTLWVTGLTGPYSFNIWYYSEILIYLLPVWLTMIIDCFILLTVYKYNVHRVLLLLIQQSTVLSLFRSNCIGSIVVDKYKLDILRNTQY